MHVLMLMKEEAVKTPKHLDAKEVVQQPQVLQGELSAETSYKLSKKLSRGGHEDDVVDVEEKVCRCIAVMIHK